MICFGEIKTETGTVREECELTFRRYFDAEAAGVLAASVSDVIRTQFKYAC